MTVVSYDNNTGLIIARTRELTAADVGLYRVGCFTTDEGISTINSPKTTRIVLFGAADVRAVIPQQINVQEETKVRTVHYKSLRSKFKVKHTMYLSLMVRFFGI